MPRLPYGALLASLLVTGAHGAQPLLTDDAGVLAAGEHELSLGLAQARSSGTRQNSGALGASVGTPWRTQLDFSLQRAEGDHSTALCLGGKTRLLGEEDDPLALSLGWGATLDHGSEDPGRHDHWRHADNRLSLIASWPAWGGRWDANLAHEHDRLTHHQQTSWGMAHSRDPIPLGELQLTPAAELLGNDQGETWWNLGLALAGGEDSGWSAGAALAGRWAHGERLITVSLKYGF